MFAFDGHLLVITANGNNATVSTSFMVFAEPTHDQEDNTPLVLTHGPETSESAFTEPSLLWTPQTSNSSTTIFLAALVFVANGVVRGPMTINVVRLDLQENGTIEVLFQKTDEQYKDIQQLPPHGVWDMSITSCDSNQSARATTVDNASGQHPKFVLYDIKKKGDAFSIETRKGMLQHSDLTSISALFEYAFDAIRCRISILRENGDIVIWE